MNRPQDLGGTSADLRDSSALALALLAKQARAQVGQIVRAEPIAVIGMGCRFPGGADDLDSYWDIIDGSVDAIGPLPRDRFDVDAHYDADPATPGKMTVTSGGFIDGVDAFDADFFGIIGREAERMDPQHRIFLEVAVDALDHAGVTRTVLAGSATGVFVASYYHDYELLQLADADAIDGRMLTGTQQSVLANRLSYLLDLRGPSVSVDTACSSSLVAVHLACQSLRSGDSDLALAGGVSLMLTPDMMIALSKIGFLSPSGRCRTFDAAADGFVRGEGCGVIVLKRLADAVAEGDDILAVIRGSAVNQDGHSTVLTAPNGLAQRDLVRTALRTAQVRPERVGYVEAHGTATPLGDPIEVEALAEVIGRPSDGAPCYVGSVKANIGHLEAAAGVAGLIKTVLMLRHGKIPAQAGFATPNPHLELAGTRLRVADRGVDWPPADAPRLAGVSGFGVGGTNAHVVLEEAPVVAPSDDRHRQGQPEILAISAQSDAALRALATSWNTRLTSATESVWQLCAAAARRRSHYDHRLAVVGATTSELRASMRTSIETWPPVTPRSARARTGRVRVPFVFSGQGTQWAAMASELLDSEPIVASVLGDLDERFAALGEWSLVDELRAPEHTSRLADTEIAQPAIFAVQVALAELWASWGVEPTAVIGHSIGELAAMHVAGALDRDDAVRIVWHRGRIMQRATGLGSMTAVSLTAEETRALVRDIGGGLSVAAINAPTSSVVSGPTEAVELAEAQLGERRIRFHRLPVPYAFHSTVMEPFRHELVSEIGPLAAQAPRIPVYSTVTGRRLDHREVAAPYFGRNMCDTVLFAEAVTHALREGVDAVVEVAPHPALAASVVECAPSPDQSEPLVVASMRRQQPERTTMLASLAQLYGAGFDPDWSALYAGPVPAPPLPSYPWQRQRYWLPGRGGPGALDPLLGRRTVSAPGRTTFDSSSSDMPWIADHVIGGHVLMPAAVLLATMKAAATEAGAAGPLRDLDIHEPLVLDDGGAWRTVVDTGRTPVSVTVWSVPDDAGAQRCIAQGVTGDEEPASPDRHPLSFDGSGWNDAGAFYDRLAELGASFGPTFRRLDRWRVPAAGVAHGRLRPVGRDVGPGGTGGIPHPAILDGALQLCTLASQATGSAGLLIPVAVGSFAVHGRAVGELCAEATIEATAMTVDADVRVLDSSGATVAALDGIRFAVVDPGAVSAIGRRQAPLYDDGWTLLDGSTDVGVERPGPSKWLVVTSGRGGDHVVEQLERAGGICRSVRLDELTGESDASAVHVDIGDVRSLRNAISEFFDGFEGDCAVVHAAALDCQCSPIAECGDDRSILGTALDLVGIVESVAPTATLWWLTEHAQPVTGTVGCVRGAGLWGLASVVEREYPDLDLRLVDLPAHPVASLVSVLSDPGGPARSGLRGTDQWVPRVRRHRRRMRLDPQAGARLVTDGGGTIDGIGWTVFASPATPAGHLGVRTSALGLNFRDLMLALDMYDGDAPFGAECAGVVESVGADVEGFEVGDRVFGFAPGSLATHVVVPARFLHRTPASMSDIDAASLTVAHLTARYGLAHLARVGPGDRVLIHAAAGGVGLAAVAYCLATGAEVFATAGTAAKRALLVAAGAHHVFDSRSTAFADEVIELTSGEGVSLVLNSLSGELIEASVRALAHDGCFLEIGKRGIWDDERMATARPDVRYYVYDLGQEAQVDPALVSRMLDELVEEWQEGRLAPMPTRVFDATDVTEAFRWMAQARHVGKIVLRTAPRAESVSSEATYWVTGGTGELGLQTARWLVDQGASHVVLSARTEPDDDARARIDELRHGGAAVRFVAADAADADAMSTVHREIVETMPPLRGVVHAAGVIDDGMLVNQTWPRFAAVMSGKALGAAVLDRLTTGDCLDFFVYYSAGGLLLGSPGQGAYAAANAQLDALAWRRRCFGAPALSVAWGPWSSGGMAGRLRASGGDAWERRGVGAVGPDEAFDALARLLEDGSVTAAVLPVDWTRFLESLPESADRSRYADVAPFGAADEVDAADGVGPNVEVDRWRAATPRERRRRVIEHVADLARQVIGLDASFRFDERAALKESGLDSLMAVELRNALTRSLGIHLPTTIMFDHPSLDGLSTFLLDLLDLGDADGRVGAESEPSGTDAHADLVGISADEAELLLLSELGESEHPS